MGAGELRGRRLLVPPGVRPTEARVREALFSIWSERLPEARWLELFAGSGAVGIEALSRGAHSVDLVENDRRALRALATNLESLGVGAAQLLTGSIPEILPALESRGPYDLVFADPPYAWPIPPSLFTALARLTAADSELAIEHSARRELPEAEGPWVRRAVRRYGDSALSFYGRLS